MARCRWFCVRPEWIATATMPVFLRRLLILSAPCLVREKTRRLSIRPSSIMWSRRSILRFFSTAKICWVMVSMGLQGWPICIILGDLSIPAESFLISGVMVAETGLAVLAVANAGQQAVATAVAAAVAWALSVTIFALTPGWSGRYLWRAIPSLLALLSLCGLPGTLGFVVRFTAYSGLEADLVALSVALLGEAFAVAALVRLWFWSEPRPFAERRIFEPILLAVFALAAILLLLTGLSPEIFAGRGQDTALLELSALIGQGGVTGWAGWALPLVAGVTLFLAGEGLRQRTEAGWRGLGTMLRLGWVYGLFYVGARLVASLLRGMSSVVEGEGALLWTTVILLIILLYLTGSQGPLGP